jgi:hypothetical protein
VALIAPATDTIDVETTVIVVHTTTNEQLYFCKCLWFTLIWCVLSNKQSRRREAGRRVTTVPLTSKVPPHRLTIALLKSITFFVITQGLKIYLFGKFKLLVK